MLATEQLNPAWPAFQAVHKIKVNLKVAVIKAIKVNWIKWVKHRTEERVEH